MKSLQRIVLVCECLAFGLLIGCDDQSGGTAQATNVNQQKSKENAPSFSSTPVGTADAAATGKEKAGAATDETGAAGAVKDPHAVTEKRAAHKPGQPIDPAAYIVKAEKSEVDMGDVPTNDIKKATITLVNTGDTSMTIKSAKASCGCTTLKFTPNTVLPAQEKLELEVQLSGGTRPGPIRGKTVTFTVEGQPDVLVRLKGQAISYVAMEPAELDPAKNPEGKFKLKSVDGQPFRVMSAHPAALNDYNREAKAEHELAFSWEKFRELGIALQAMIYVDHPKCQMLTVTVKFDPKEVAEDRLKQREKMQREAGIPAQPGVHEGMQPGELAAQPVGNEPDPGTVVASLIKQGQNAEVISRLDGDLDVNRKDSKGITLLGLAAMNGNIEVMEALLATKRVNLEAGDNAGCTPLMYAARAKNPKVMKVLLDAGAKLETKDNIGGTALSWAAALGDAASVEALIKAGAEVEVVGTWTGWTPLIWAAAVGEAESIEPLMKANANIEAADAMEGATPLIRAARTGKPQTIKALIKHGANLESMDRNGYTALLAAAMSKGGDAEKIKALIDAGADYNAKNNQGYNALQLARKRTDADAPAVIEILEPLLADQTPAEPVETPVTPE